QRRQPLPQHVQGLLAEPGANVARVLQAAVALDADEQGTEPAGPHPLARLPAPAPDLLPLQVLDLPPPPGPLSRLLPGRRPLPPVPGRLPRPRGGRRALATAPPRPAGEGPARPPPPPPPDERGRRLPARPMQAKPSQQGPPCPVGLVEQRPPVQVQQVERQVG